MPNSSKPRKRYHRRERRIPYLHRSTLDEIRAETERVEIAVRMKLHLGKCTAGEVREIREMLNTVMFSLMHRGNAYVQTEALKDLIAEAGIALGELIERGDKVGHYTCTAEQLAILPEALSSCVDFIKLSLDDCPLTFVDEFHGAMLIVMALPPGCAFVVNHDVVEFAFKKGKELARTPNRYLERACEVAIEQVQRKMRGRVIEGTLKELKEKENG